ncbi:hypothetical protein EW145_g3840 [Phellinidium pouzarii]|uniref:protein-ribulosamine 3-kinase n=1 Tax=Phellinidium pouzarii TaxID=167371 RepID=A0A4S4L5P9_9AGAM|nr:hypothetical protein EW145_g3840 [Phellinidium pouzarii]
MALSILLQKIKELEPESDFTVDLPLITSSSGRRYYAKVGDLSEQEQYLGEVESLKHIVHAAPGLAPRVLVSGTNDEECPYFISEYKDVMPHSSASMTKLATRLATELHVHKSEQGFGFGVPTFCGLTRLENGWFDTWEKCFDALIGSLQEGLEKRGSNVLCEKIASVRKTVIPYLLQPLRVDPVILHGDLWSGNTGVDSTSGEPIVYDPSSFYGHNEADLAIARIFGGFPQTFF